MGYNRAVLDWSMSWIRTLAGVRPVRWLMGLLELAGYVAVAAMFWLRPDWLIELVVAGVIVWFPGRLVYGRLRRRRASGGVVNNTIS